MKKGHQNEIPKWATKEDIADFRKMLENEQPVLFDGIPIEGEKRQRVIDILSGLFWEEKLEQDRKRKSKDNEGLTHTKKLPFFSKRKYSISIASKFCT